MTTALVSIITPSYNSEKFIGETITSVLRQTYQNWELIIVDDCSKDKTLEIIRSFMDEDSRIHLHSLSKNSGAGIARNTALQFAQGRYIAFLDSDDCWKPEKLEKQLAFMEAEKQPFAFSFYECMDETSQPLGRMITTPNPLGYTQLFFCNFVGNLTGIYDTDYFGKIAISSLRKRQDWMVWLTLLKNVQKAKPIPESLAWYRIRKDSISSSKLKLLPHNYAVYRQFHRKNVVVSLLCMLGFLGVQLLVKPRFVKQV